MLRNELDAGHRVRIHVRDVEEILLVIFGSITVYADGASHGAGAGDAVVVPAGCQHAFEVSGAKASVVAVLAAAAPVTR